MIPTKLMKQLSLSALLALGIITCCHGPLISADQTSPKAPAAIETKLKAADKVAQPLYDKMDQLQKAIDTIREEQVGKADKDLTAKIDDLFQNHQALLDKFYESISDDCWTSAEEAQQLVAKSSLSDKDKSDLTTLFEETGKLEKELDGHYDRLDKATQKENAQLEELDKEIDAIYKKHGISESDLENYYMNQDLPAD
ncbi:chromosome assembly protein [Streptococcus dysgalactiae]|uniref:chromosome assembly protein n=1 Tax=Streptococcus dysgalactiae TaxID=1334 RepID=UPI001C4D352B|nr:chromosome assembly protein [Streptococcus dysgalactiae]